ncbi:helix-turn-helix domain-containing protein [Polymorphobacter fuscus]|uniref:Helix-turn-helix domain-containing protein n=1 Tax=Sandarakinorhabdus fusca TaxID=1439888 RepID=A0A7C9KX07_9SPHN|nr:AraC family transcriptional regulator [Polymorphobacter fuscus]KAB7646251.1 helix-turn-helix transcriptional regulator [Polymorphobacter fuscus]MQT17465.1 helix-turn-helix domain-containing protein [Polymorphobacter fuscus]NJC09998.1 transcriptional regulator GlxA family with amidase domain [Polymorphobacter fuscus]
MQQSSSPDLPPAGVLVAALLVADVQAALGRDSAMVRRCLTQLSGLLATGPAGHRPAVDAPRSAPAATGGLANWQVTAITAHVEAHYHRSIGIAELAALANLSEGHFCRSFKAHFGRTPHRYVVARRVAHAQRLMVTTHESLSLIAFGCGFTDQAHLTRIFRRDVGDTPSAWRSRSRPVN